MSEMIVTIVHDDRDCIKYQLKIMRDGLKHVTPRVNFKSCCVWEFTDNVFDENRAVLVILTKQCKPFRHKVLESFQRYRDRCRKVECRVCVVFEVEGADGDGMKEDFESVIGKENVVNVEDLYQSVKWLPKVCTFLFKIHGRNKELKCVIPRVRNRSEEAVFRKDLLISLRELDIDVLEVFDDLPPRCCILFKEHDDYDLAPSVKDIPPKKMYIKRVGGTIFEYKRSYTDESRMQSSNEIIYGRDSLVLFIIHLLYVMEVINITTMLGQRLWRIKKSNETAIDCECCDSITCCSSPLECCSELDYECCDSITWFNSPLEIYNELDCACYRCVGFLFLSIFNPSLIIFSLHRSHI